MPDTSYQPDGDEDLWDELAAAIHVRGAILLTTWLLSGYGDDIQPTHGELESLLARFDRLDDSPMNMARIRSLSKRVAAELAFQRGDYPTALNRIADAVYHLRFVHRDNLVTPWLSEVNVHARAYFEHVEQMSGRGIDWPEVFKACEKLSKCFYCPLDDCDVYPDQSGTWESTLPALENAEHVFWIEKMGWTQAQLTPDQLRVHLGNQEDESAVQRLRTYFFADGLWGKLSKRAQEALVSADRAFVTGTQSRYAAIANEIRIATEEVLYHCLWLPLSETQRLPHPGLRMILDKPKQDRRSPSIGDYVQLLWNSGIKDYFQDLDLSSDDMRFLTKDNRTTKHLQTIRDARNAAEHEPGDTVDPQTVRQLYTESLGIGRRGVLPELVRLLAKDRRGAA